MLFSYALSIVSIARGEVAAFNGITPFEIKESLQRCKGITFIYDPGALRHLMNEAELRAAERFRVKKSTAGAGLHAQCRKHIGADKQKTRVTR